MATNRKFQIPEDEFTIQKKQDKEPVKETITLMRETKKKPKTTKYKFNLALDDETAEYVKREAIVRGYTITEFLNLIIAEYMNTPGNKHYIG